MKKISSWLIVAGVLIALLPLVGNALLNQQQLHLEAASQKKINIANENRRLDDTTNAAVGYQSPNSVDDIFEQSRDYRVALKYFTGYIGQDDIANSDRPQDNRLRFNFEPPSTMVNIDGLQYLGKIEIPSIQLSMPLVDGTKDTDIAISAGHMIGTAYPNQLGNCVIVGHRGYSFGRLFNRLDELSAGDTITVTVGDEQTTYTTYLSKVVLPTDLSVINQTDKAKVLTLITCTPLFSSEYRLVIHAVKK